MSNFVPSDGIREDVLNYRLHDYFGSQATYERKKSTKLRTGATGWLIRDGRVTQKILADLKQDTIKVEEALKTERATRPSPQALRSSQENQTPSPNGYRQAQDVHGRQSRLLPSDSLHPSRPTASPHEQLATGGMAPHRAGSLSNTDPAFAARHPEREFTVDDFPGYSDFQYYLRLREVYTSAATPTEQKYPVSSSSRRDEDYTSAATPTEQNYPVSTSSRRDEDNDDSNATVSHGRSLHMPRYRTHNDVEYADDRPFQLGRPVDLQGSVRHGGARSSALRHDNSINPFKRKGKLLDLPILLGKDVKQLVKVNAIPDTGATINVISRRFLEDTEVKDVMGFNKYFNTHSTRLNMADGSTIHTIGELVVLCSFLDAPANIMLVVFHVCEALAENIRVILGRQFLETTKTLTSFAHRMIERRRDLHATPWVMRLATQEFTPKSQLRILIDSRPTLAYPDTGSEIDLFSSSFARRTGIEARALGSSDPTEIQYASGRRESILWKAVVDVSIEKDTHAGRHRQSFTDEESADNDSFGSDALFDSIGKPMQSASLAQRTEPRFALSRQRTFYLVKGLACDIILGQAFLYSIDAYNTYKYAFVGSGAPNGPDTLNGIFVTARTGHQDTGPTKPTSKVELNAALNKLDQQYILSKREVEKKISTAKDDSTKRRLEAEKETLKQKHDTDSQRIRKQYDDSKAQYPARR